PAVRLTRASGRGRLEGFSAWRGVSRRSSIHASIYHEFLKEMHAMKMRFSKLALLFGAVLAAAALATPVCAQDPEPNPDVCAVIKDSRTLTSVVITRFGTAFLICCGKPILCG